MFDPDSDIDGKSGKRSFSTAGEKRRKPQPSAEQEYEEGIEGVWDSPTISSSSSTEPFVIPQAFGKRSFSSAFGTNSWDDWMSKRRDPTPSNRDVELLSTLSQGPTTGRHQMKTIYPGSAGVYATAASPTLLLVNGLGAGALIYDRVGRQVHLHSFHMKLYLQPSVGDYASRTDVYLIYDRQTNGALPAVLDILEESLSMALPRFDNRHRFEVLLHRSYSTCPPNSQYGYGGNCGCIDDVFKKLDGRLTQYKGDNSLIGSIASGSLLLLIIGRDEGNGDYVEFSYRLVYSE